MIKNWLKILPAIYLFMVQFVIAIHIHDTNDIITVSDKGCVYCKLATGISNIDIPDVLSIKYPLCFISNYNVFFTETFSCCNFSNNHYTRPPPQA